MKPTQLLISRNQKRSISLYLCNYQVGYTLAIYLGYLENYNLCALSENFTQIYNTHIFTMRPATPETAGSDNEEKQTKGEALSMEECAAALPSPPTTPQARRSIVRGEILGKDLTEEDRSSDSDQLEVTNEGKKYASEIKPTLQHPIQWEWLGTCSSCLDQNIQDQQTVCNTQVPAYIN